MRAAVPTAIGLLWLGGVVYLRLFRSGFGIVIALPKWLPQSVGAALLVAVSVIVLLGWAVPLGAGLHGMLKRD